MGLMYEVQDVIDLFVAIISHEFIMSFSIGMELVKYNKTKAVSRERDRQTEPLSNRVICLVLSGLRL